ncbi:hypothetical protein DFH28DRAFT_1081515 [Melampsora americana]|nr:hypothetical protein DFH28DRAFT_1081515 [Melampsora americana]
MFAGYTESLFSDDTATPRAPLPTPLPCQSGLRRSATSGAQANRTFNSPFDEIGERVRRLSVREEEFGWSGSIGGIRGRDDRQIERDAEYERKMEERRQRRHEPPRRVTLGSSLPADIDSLNAAHKSTHDLRRGKSLRERVGAALNRFQTSTSRTSPHGNGSYELQRTQSLSPQKFQTVNPPAQPNTNGGLNRSITGLARKISRKINIEERRNSDADLYAAPPTLSHTLVGPASPFPMRPPLSSLVSSVPAYGEAHNPYSLDPVRRGPYRPATRPGQIRAQ